MESGRGMYPYPRAQSGRQSGRLRRRGAASNLDKGTEEVTGHALLEAAREDPSRYGICLSGGGIRASAFSLGALHSMDREGMIRGTPPPQRRSPS